MTFSCVAANQRRYEILRDYRMQHSPVETITNYLSDHDAQLLHWELYHNLPAKVKRRSGAEFLDMVQVHTYTSGNSFGELSLQLDRRDERAARIVTVSDCHFAWLNKLDFKKCLEKFIAR